MRHRPRNTSGPVPSKKPSNKAAILFALLLVGMVVCLMYIVQESLDPEVPPGSYDTRSAGTVVDIRFHHGFGTRTEVRTTTDILLVVEAARLAIGQEVVLQHRLLSERLCSKDLQRCWRVATD